jgi:hypothetical protein
MHGELSFVLYSTCIIVYAWQASARQRLPQATQSNETPDDRKLIWQIFQPNEKGWEPVQSKTWHTLTKFLQQYNILKAWS